MESKCLFTYVYIQTKLLKINNTAYVIVVYFNAKNRAHPNGCIHNFIV
jgi:hypothetical protein